MPNEKIPGLKKDWEAAEATIKAAKKEGHFEPFEKGFEALAKSKEAA